jgi:hypothetical protein
MRQRELRRLTAEYDGDLISDEEEVQRSKASGQPPKKQHPKIISLVGEEPLVNDEDFEDMISLHSSGR